MAIRRSGSFPSPTRRFPRGRRPSPSWPNCAAAASTASCWSPATSTPRVRRACSGGPSAPREAARHCARSRLPTCSFTPVPGGVPASRRRSSSRNGVRPWPLPWGSDRPGASDQTQIPSHFPERFQGVVQLLPGVGRGDDGPHARSAFRHGEDPFEAEAKRRGLTYVHLPGGSIGCIGNGAGLAMNTLELVQQVGARPNNFLDIGGVANAEKVRSSLSMILSAPDVRGVFINIFGGITRGDEVARGIVQARDELGITVPLVVRMTGTNEVEGRRILAEAGIVPGTSAPEAARKIVELVGGAG